MAACAVLCVIERAVSPTSYCPILIPEWDSSNPLRGPSSCPVTQARVAAQVNTPARALTSP